MRSDGAITETLPCKSNDNSIVAQRALQFIKHLFHYQGKRQDNLKNV